MTFKFSVFQWQEQKVRLSTVSAFTPRISNFARMERIDENKILVVLTLPSLNYLSRIPVQGKCWAFVQNHRNDFIFYGKKIYFILAMFPWHFFFCCRFLIMPPWSVSTDRLQEVFEALEIYWTKTKTFFFIMRLCSIFFLIVLFFLFTLLMQGVENINALQKINQYTFLYWIIENKHDWITRTFIYMYTFLLYEY